MRHLTLLLLTVFLSLAPAMRGDDVPRFFIESINVNGGSPASERIVAAESRLRAGETYDEAQLRDAMARIQRLPFVISADFRLAKGSQFGRYVLVVDLQQMKPLFALAESTTSWIEQSRILPQPDGTFLEEEWLNQVRTNELVVGARTFVGKAGMLNAAAERVEHRHDRYTVSYTQYDLFGTRASLTALVSYLDDPGARTRGAPNDRYDWHFRDNLTWEVIGVVPIGRNDSLRASWQRSERPISYFAVDDGEVQHILRSLPQIRKEIFWIHDTTDDPLFPSRGTRITAGATRTDTPTAGSTLLGRLKLDELKVSAERSFALTQRQALTGGVNGSDYDRVIRRYDAFARYSFDLWGRERTLRNGDLRLELGADRVFTSIRENPFDAQSTVRASVVYRNPWGVLRLTGQYLGWGTD